MSERLAVTREQLLFLARLAWSGGHMHRGPKPTLHLACADESERCVDMLIERADEATARKAEAGKLLGEIAKPAAGPLAVMEIGRGKSFPNGLAVYFNRQPSDQEVQALHERLMAFGKPADTNPGEGAEWQDHAPLADLASVAMKSMLLAFDRGDEGSKQSARKHLQELCTRLDDMAETARLMSQGRR